MKFKELKLNRNILKALAEAGYEQPTPIQEQSIPSVLEGRDLLGCAQTGTASSEVARNTATSVAGAR